MTTFEHLNHNPDSVQHPKADKEYHTNVSETLRKIDSGPSHNAAPEKKARPRQVPVDLIEEESMESFPASDPPGHFRSHTSDKVEPHRPTDDEV